MLYNIYKNYSLNIFLEPKCISNVLDTDIPVKPSLRILPRIAFISFISFIPSALKSHLSIIKGTACDRMHPSFAVKCHGGHTDSLHQKVTMKRLIWGCATVVKLTENTFLPPQNIPLWPQMTMDFTSGSLSDLSTVSTMPCLTAALY